MPIQVETWTTVAVDRTTHYHQLPALTGRKRERLEDRMLNRINATDSPTTHAQSISTVSVRANADPKTRTLEGLRVLRQRHICERHTSWADKPKCTPVTSANLLAPRANEPHESKKLTGQWCSVLCCQRCFVLDLLWVRVERRRRHYGR